MDAFQRLLEELIQRHGGTAADLAKAVGITPSRMSHLRAVGGASPGTFLCLRLAQVSGVSPTAVLRAAGKGDHATLLEEMFGPPRTFVASTLTVAERATIAKIRALSTREQRVFHSLIARMTERPTATAGGAPEATNKTPEPETADDNAHNKIA
jgi:hypothetical protein